MILLGILVSACLAGRTVHYNGSAKTMADGLLDRWMAQRHIVSVCPRVLAELPTPRPPSEIADGRDGVAVMQGAGRIVEAREQEVTTAYPTGARLALDQAIRPGCRHALPTDGSPSCGSGFIYVGSFAGRRIDGLRVTAALLQQHGVAVFALGQEAFQDGIDDRCLAVVDQRDALFRNVDGDDLTMLRQQHRVRHADIAQG